MAPLFRLPPPLLDRVEIGAVGRQVKQSGAGVLDRRSNALYLVAPQIVQDDDIAGLELGSEELLDPGAELLAVDRPIEGARRNQTVLPQLSIIMASRTEFLTVPNTPLLAHRLKR